jgi:serine/threonine protein kinase
MSRPFGPYVLYEELGTGTSGTVFRARAQTPPRDLAIKLLQERPDPDSDAERRFLREMGLVATLDHPNLVKIRANGTINGVRYIAMELVKGLSLQELIAVNGALEPALALAICSQIAQALVELHSRGILHRDIKPANVLLAQDGHVKVADFGLMRAEGSTLLTQPGALVGTLPYLAPEVLSRGEYSVRSDIWAVGVTLYRMLTDRMPVDSANLMQWLTVPDGRQIPSPRSLQPEIPPEVSDLAMQLLEPEPSLRDMDAAGVSAALAKILAQLGVANAQAVLSAKGTRTFLERSAGLTSGTESRRPVSKPSRSRALTGTAVALALIAIGYVFKPAPLRHSNARPSPSVEAAAPVSEGRLVVFVRKAATLDAAVKVWTKAQMNPAMDGKRLRDSTKELLPEALRIAHFWRTMDLPKSALVAGALGKFLDGCWATGLLDRESGLAHEFEEWSRANEAELLAALWDLGPAGEPGRRKVPKTVEIEGSLARFLAAPKEPEQLPDWLLGQARLMYVLYKLDQQELAGRAAYRLISAAPWASMRRDVFAKLYPELCYHIQVNRFQEALLRLQGDMVTAAIHIPRGKHVDPQSDGQEGWKDMWWAAEERPHDRATTHALLMVSEWTPWLSRRAQKITQELLVTGENLLERRSWVGFLQLMILIEKLCRVHTDLNLDRAALTHAFCDWQQHIPNCWPGAYLEAFSCALEQDCQAWRTIAVKAEQFVEDWARTEPPSLHCDRARVMVAVLPIACYLMQGGVATVRDKLKRTRDGFFNLLDDKRRLTEADLKQIRETVASLVPQPEAAR